MPVIFLFPIALKQSMFGEGIGLFAHDQMIQDIDLHHSQRLFNQVGDVLVSPTGIRHAGRMVMTQDAGGGVVFHSGLDDFAGMDACAIDRAPEQFLEDQHPVFVIQPEDGEHLMFKAGEAQIHERLALPHAVNDDAPREAAIDFRKGGFNDFIPGRRTIAPAVIPDHQRTVIEFLLQHPFRPLSFF